MLQTRAIFLFPIILFGPAVANGQKPIISKVVNAASYATGGRTGKAVALGSIVSIFGENLAQRDESAAGFPLPFTLGGTSVTVQGVSAPLLLVSSKQINFQMPASLRGSPEYRELFVKTTAGTSDPYLIETFDAFGIFTQDQSGCGPGLVFNVAKDGTVSLNSPSNSASPGDFLTIYGTGLGFVVNEPPDGTPAPLNPLTLHQIGAIPIFDFDVWGPVRQWAGRAPGSVGIDQINVQIPMTVREGCAVPLTYTSSGLSQPVTVSIRKGGGQCIDPLVASYGQMVWERIIATGSEPSGETDVLTVSFPASPGKRLPPVEQFREGCNVNLLDLYGPSCPIRSYQALDAGALTVQASAFGEVNVSSTMIDGQTGYRAVLPRSSIQSGSYKVIASGAEVGGFESTLLIGSPITLISSFPPGTVLPNRRPLVVSWSGGDPDAWVTMKLVHKLRYLDQYSVCRARASAGSISLGALGLSLGISPGPDIEIVIEVTPDPSKVVGLSAPGLSLGGRHSWKYTYRFGGLTLQ